MSETGIKVEVDDFEIYYEKHGNGDHHLLLLPGLLGKITFHSFIHLIINNHFNLYKLNLIIIKFDR